LAGIWPDRHCPTARGHIAKEKIFPGSLLQKVNSNSKTLYFAKKNSKTLWLLLVNCVENHRKSEKCKTNFVGFLMNYTTTFVILA
jgi:hypothetical protein